MTHVNKDVYEVTAQSSLHQFQLKRVERGGSHKRAWDLYYDVMKDLVWPDAATVSRLAPPHPNRYRERDLRESINYTPGLGFLEIYDSASRYKSRRAHLMKLDLNSAPKDESAFLEQEGFYRLDHAIKLLDAVRVGYLSSTDLESKRQIQRKLINDYAGTTNDTKLLQSCIPA